MPNDANTTPRDMEDAVSRLLVSNPHMTRGDAIEHIAQSVHGGDPDYTSIPDVAADLHHERTRAFAKHALSGFTDTALALPKFAVTSVLDAAGVPEASRRSAAQAISSGAREYGPIARTLLGPVGDLAPEVSQYFHEPTRQEIGPESPGGELTGSLAAFMVPGGPSEQFEAAGKLIPGVSKLMGATSLPARIALGAGEGVALGGMGAYGDQPMEIGGRDVPQWKVGAAVGGAGPLVSDALGVAWNKLAGRYAKAATDEAGAASGVGGAGGGPPDPPDGGGPAYRGGPTSIDPAVPETPKAPPIDLRPRDRIWGTGKHDEEILQRQGDLAAGLMPDRPEQAPSWWQRAQLMPTEAEAGPTGTEPVSGPEEPATPTQPVPGPVVAPVSEPSRAWFAQPPMSRGFQKTAEERLRETEGEPIGTTLMREGQPFSIERHNELDGQRQGLKVYAYPTSSLGRAGRPARVDLEKPMVIDVGSTGEQAFVDAARALYADNPKVLAALDRAKDRVGLSQELISRRAQKGGYDAVSLATPDMTENVILGTKDFKASPHPELDKATQASINLRRPAAKAAARAVETVEAPSVPRSPFRPKAAPEPAEESVLDPLRVRIRQRADRLREEPEQVQEQRVAERAEVQSRGEPIPPKSPFAPKGESGTGDFEAELRKQLAYFKGGSTERVTRFVEKGMGRPLTAAEKAETAQRVAEASMGGSAPRDTHEVVKGFGWGDPRTKADGTISYDHTKHGGVIQVHPDQSWTYGVYQGKDAQSLFKYLQEDGADKWTGVVARGGAGAAFDPEEYARLEAEEWERTVAADKKAAEEAKSAGPFAETSPAQAVASAGLSDDLSGLHPEVQAIPDRLHEARLGILAYYRPVSAAIDHPIWNRAQMTVLKTQAVLGNFTKRFGTELATILKGISETDFNEIARAMEGLRHDQEGVVQQTAIDIKPAHDAIARKIKVLTDEVYTILTGNDPQVPVIMERLGLPHNRKQLERLRILQTPGPERDALYASRRPPGHGEQIAAASMKGMLNFDNSHDLDIVPWKGFLSFYPIENERAKIADAIRTMEAEKAAGYSPTGMADLDKNLKEYQARLDHIDEQVRNEPYRKLPNRDNIPKHRFMAPLKAMKSPAAKALFPDMNVPKVVSKFISGALDKRQSDVVLDEVHKLLANPAFKRVDVQQYAVDWANTVRGSRGYYGDARFAQNWNAAFGKFLPATPQNVHNITSYIMSMQSFTKLRLIPLRFPIINLTHMFISLYPVVGEKIFAQALADVLADPQRWFDEAAKAGAIRPEQDFIRELGDPKVASVGGPLRQAWNAPNYVTENLRRAVAYRAGLITEPGEWSPLVKAFNKEGHASLQEAREAYARGLTLTTQFDTSITNKPLAFTGSPFRRLATQFRTWPVSLADLYVNMAKKGEWGSLMRGMGALYFFGGVSAIAGGPSVYGQVRDHFLRHGYNLPNETGAENLADTLGLQGTPVGQVLGMNLGSLHDPFALVPQNWHSVAGPAIGSALDAREQVAKAIQSEDYKSLYGIVLAFVSPQARAAVQATQEYFNNGKIFGPSGHLELSRPTFASFLRGADLMPSARGTRYSDMQDIAAAMESGNQRLVGETRSKAKRDGVMMDGHFEAGLRAILKRRKGSKIFKRERVNF